MVRLTAAPATIAERLGRRDAGAQLAEHLAEAASFAAEAEAAGIGDVVLATDDRSIGSVARAVLVSAGWEASR